MFPSTLMEIGSYAFESCEMLKNITFAPGSRLKKIGQNCFSGTGIEKIVIPKGVTEI